MIRPGLDEFRTLARTHTVIPVWRELLADLKEIREELRLDSKNGHKSNGNSNGHSGEGLSERHGVTAEAHVIEEYAVVDRITAGHQGGSVG